MRLTDTTVVYHAHDNDSVKHLWPKGRAHQALCGDPLQPWGEMRRVEGYEMDKESPAADCAKCLIQHAARLALLAHDKQRDLDGSLHIEHVRRVAIAVHDESEPLLTVIALLHDVVEDSSLTPQRLREEHFPSVVIDAVVLLTRETGGDPYGDYIVALLAPGEANRLARRVKLCDALDNLRRSTARGDEKRIDKYTRLVGHLTGGMAAPREISDEMLASITESYG
jgi:(p)ppGpp synthase/HD superfamily hydrolase